MTLSKILLAALSTTLTACATAPTGYWSGGDQQAFNADNSYCQLYAYKTVPDLPPMKEAPLGAGGMYGQQYGEAQRRNDQARGNAFTSCMYQKGWQWRSQ